MDGDATELLVPLKIAHGLHARPAAVLANAAKAHSGTVQISCNGKTVNAKSVVALMGLGTRFGDNLTIRIEGPGADETGDKLLDLVLSGLGDPIADAPAPEPQVPPAASEKHQAVAPSAEAAFVPGAEALVNGRSAVGGFAAGAVTRRARLTDDLPKDGKGADQELARLTGARASVIERLGQETDDAAQNAIAAAHRDILDDPALMEAAEAEIKAGHSAEWAWNTACTEQAEMLGAMADARMAERAADLRDIAGQVIGALTGKGAAPGLAALPAGSIVLADEILPSEMLGLTADHIAAILMRDGGPTSHAAILAAGLGIPTIVAIGPDADRIPDGAPVIIDAKAGKVTVYPAPAALEEARAKVSAQAEKRTALRAAAQRDCHLTDGTRIEVFANLGHSGEGTLAVSEGAEGCGLLRTEFLFLDRDTAPTEDEQFNEYQTIADELGGKPLIIRLFDAGGDKPMSYLPLPAEENPFLGLRGIRVGLAKPELLHTQIRAILRVKPYGVARIMVPMVASVTEIDAVRKLVEEEAKALGRDDQIQVGAMIETPAAAVTARQLARVCDFFSIGTNDLTQYTLAMDRGNPAVAKDVDALHPGVLGLIRQTAIGAEPFKRVVAVCGGAASDPVAAPILIGLGVTELSVAPAMIPEIKGLLEKLSLAECQALANKALEADTPEAVRALASA